MCVCGFVLIFKTTTTNFSVTVSHIRSCAASSFCLLLTDSSDSSFNFTFVVLLYLTAQKSFKCCNYLPTSDRIILSKLIFDF